VAPPHPLLPLGGGAINISLDYALPEQRPGSGYAKNGTRDVHFEHSITSRLGFEVLVLGFDIWGWAVKLFGLGFNVFGLDFGALGHPEVNQILGAPKPKVA